MTERSDWQWFGNASHFMIDDQVPALTTGER